MKKLSPYVKKRIAQIKSEQRKNRPKRKYKKKIKLVNFELKTRGFYLNMDLNTKDSLDMKIFEEANKLIIRRASVNL